MKKLLLVLLSLSILLVGCGKNIPEGFTEDEFEKSEKVLEIINDFLDADISAGDAVDKLDTLATQLRSSDNSDVVHIGNMASSASLHIHRIDTGLYYTDDEDIAKIKEYRDSIVEELEAE